LSLFVGSAVCLQDSSDVVVAVNADGAVIEEQEIDLSQKTDADADAGVLDYVESIYDPAFDVVKEEVETVQVEHQTVDDDADDDAALELEDEGRAAPRMLVQLQMSSGGGGQGVLLGAIGTCFGIVACLICIKKFCGAFCTRCRCRRACRCCLPMMLSCGCDDFPNFRLRIMMHHMKDYLKSRNTGDSIQLRVQHDQRVYSTKWSHDDLGNWEELLKIYVEQGVKYLFFEVWSKSVLGKEKLLGECCVDIQKDIIRTNYPGRIWIQMRKSGHRVALLRVSFFRDGSTNDVLMNRNDEAVSTNQNALEQNIPFEITEKMHFEVSKAAQRPCNSALFLPVQVLQDSTQNYGNELRALNALAQCTRGLCKTPRGIRIVSGTRFFAIVHDPTKHPLQGWSLNRYWSEKAFDSMDPPEHCYPVGSVLSVEKTSSYLVVKHQAHGYAYDEVLYLTPKDRDLDLWYQGMCLFMIKIEALTEQFEKHGMAFSLSGDEKYENEDTFFARGLSQGHFEESKTIVPGSMMKQEPGQSADAGAGAGAGATLRGSPARKKSPKTMKNPTTEESGASIEAETAKLL